MDAAEIFRGEVYLEDLSRFGGSLGKTRPVLIVQNDLGNRYSKDVIVVAIRDARRGGGLPILVPVRRGVAGLTKDSVVDTGHVSTIPRITLKWRLGSIPLEVLEGVDRALHISLGLKR